MKDQNKLKRIKTKIMKRMNQRSSLLLTAPMLNGGNRHIHLVM